MAALWHCMYEWQVQLTFVLTNIRDTERERDVGHCKFTLATVSERETVSLLHCLRSQWKVQRKCQMSHLEKGKMYKWVSVLLYHRYNYIHSAVVPVALEIAHRTVCPVSPVVRTVEEWNVLETVCMEKSHKYTTDDDVDDAHDDGVRGREN